MRLGRSGSNPLAVTNSVVAANNVPLSIVVLFNGLNVVLTVVSVSHTIHTIP